MFNAERKTIEAGVLEQAMALAEAQEAAQKVLVVAAQGWHPGVIGIVAARIREAAGRPSFVLALDEQGLAKGSGRSVPGVDLGGAVVAAKQAGLLLNGGGHAMAAGLTVATGGIPALQEFLAERLAPQVARAGVDASLGLDGALSVGGASVELYEKLELLGPYGSGNAEPRFAIANARIMQADVVGERHVRLLVTADDGLGPRLRGISFRALDTAGQARGPGAAQAGALGEALLQARATGRPLHLAGHLRADYWRGERRIQLVVEDAAYVA